MRHRFMIWAVLGLALLTPARISGQRAPQYIESSKGLETPRMENGRTEIEFSDVNADGHVDLVSIGDHGSPFINSDQHGIMVWFGDGLGNWSLFQTGRFGYGGVALGDVDNDGAMDAGYGMHHNYSRDDFGDQLLEVALGDGTGTSWTPWDDGLATSGETWGMFGVDFADVNHDGLLDLGSVSFGCCAGVHIYLNQGDGTWTQSFGFLGGNSRQDFVFGEINGDGLADFAVAHSQGTVYLGDGKGGFHLADGNLPPPGAGGRAGLSLGDLNDDGSDDLAFVTAAGGLAIWLWVAEGKWQDLSGSLPNSGQFEATQVADMNLDGHGDVIAFGRGLTSVYAGDGAGNWGLVSTFQTPGTRGFSAFRAGTDLDHNGFPDIAIVAAEGPSPFNRRNRPRVFLESSSPSDVWVYPKSPRGGDTLVAGSVRFIEWNAAIPSRIQKATMSIELSLAGPDGPWSPIAEDLPNNGRFQWRIPANLSSQHCYLRYTLTTNEGNTVGTSPAPFTIIDQDAAGVAEATKTGATPQGRP